jgi:hypothetical protein
MTTVLNRVIVKVALGGRLQSRLDHLAEQVRLRNRVGRVSPSGHRTP